MSHIYKVHIDLSGSVDEVQDLGVPEFVADDAWLLVRANDPDDACAEATLEMYTAVKTTRRSTRYQEAAEIIKSKMRILSIIKLV